MNSRRWSFCLRFLPVLGVLGGLVLMHGAELLFLPAGLFTLTLLFDPEGLRSLARLRFWLFALSPLPFGAFLLGTRDLELLFLNLSAEGLARGALMSVRAVSLLLSFQFALRGLSVGRVIPLFHSKKLKGLGFALGVAYNMLGTLNEITLTVLWTLRLRGALRRHPLLSARLFVVTVVSAALRHGEDIVNAATARGFKVE